MLTNFRGRRWIVISGCITALANLTHGVTSVHAEDTKCQVKIEYPSGGADVGEQEQATGKAVKPAGTFLWLFAHMKGLAVWWPQGSGPTTPDPKSGEWTTTVFFGVPRDVGREFEVAAIVIDKPSNDILVKWVADTIRSQMYIPVQTPSPVTGCTPQIITVKKAN